MESADLVGEEAALPVSPMETSERTTSTKQVPSTRSSKEKTQSEQEDARSTRSSKLSNRDRRRANSDSSDDSGSSKASRPSTSKRRSTFVGTNLALRKSSVRPKFKQLSVIPSDEESVSQEDEPARTSSQPALRSQTTRAQGTKRTSQKNESEHSDAESAHSERSGNSTTAPTIRRTRRSIAMEEMSKAKPGTSSGKSTATTSKRKR